MFTPGMCNLTLVKSSTICRTFGYLKVNVKIIVPKTEHELDIFAVLVQFFCNTIFDCVKEAGNGIRTHHLLLGRQLLYQLSYTR